VNIADICGFLLAENVLIDYQIYRESQEEIFFMLIMLKIGAQIKIYYFLHLWTFKTPIINNIKIELLL
jgi:hypothetical protein